jgi:hypothetical protein
VSGQSTGLASWLAALLGAGVVAVVWFLFDGGAEEGADSLGGDGPPIIVESADQRAVLARLDGIERRLDALATAVGARPAQDGDSPRLSGRARPSAETPGHARGEASAGTAAVEGGALAVSDEALERVVDRLEKKKREQRFSKMSDQQMLAEARRLRDRERNMHAAGETLEHLLTRELDDDDRARALLELGAVHRGALDFEKSEQRLREAMRVAGEDSETGVQAGYHLIWTYSRAKNPARGLAMADHLLQSPGATKAFRPWIRWAAARMALASGDKARARSDYRALMRDLKDKQAYKQILTDAARNLKDLE